MKVLLVGDCHGFNGMVVAAHLAVDLKAEAVICLGDVWDVDAKLYISRDGQNTVPPFHVVLGNHERWAVLAKNTTFHNNVTVHRDYTTFELGGVKFGVIGRIDDTPRMRDLMAGGLFLGEPDKIFFERLEGQQVRDALGGSDVLLFHDAPFPFVLGHRPLPRDPNWKSAGPLDRPEIVGSEYLNEVVRTIEPKYALHGHMHLLDIRYIGNTRVYGLPPIDPSFERRGYVLLDTTTMKAEYCDL